MARLFVDTAELRDLSSRTRQHAHEADAIADDVRRETWDLFARRAAPRLDAWAVTSRSDHAARSLGELSRTLDHESDDLRRIADRVDALESGGAFHGGWAVPALGMGGLLSTLAKSWATAGLGPWVGLAAGGGTISLLHLGGPSGSISPGFGVGAGAVGRPSNPLAGIAARARAEAGRLAAGEWAVLSGLAGHARAAGTGVLDRLRTWALDAWNRIWDRAAATVRAVRLGLARVVTAIAVAARRAQPVVGCVGRWVLDQVRANVRWQLDLIRGASGLVAVFAGTLISHPSRLVDVVLAPDVYAPQVEPKTSKGGETVESTDEHLGFEGTLLANADVDISFTTRRVRAPDGTEWYEVDVEQEGGLGIGVGAGAEGSAGKSGKGARAQAGVSGAGSHRETFRFRTKEEAARFVAAVRSRYLHEIWKLLQLSIPEAGYSLYLSNPAKSVFDIARDLEGAPIDSGDTYETRGDASAKAKSGLADAGAGLKAAVGVDVSGGNEVLFAKFSGSVSGSVGMLGLTARGALTLAGKISIDPGDPTDVTVSASVKLSGDADLSLLEGKVPKGQLAGLKAQLAASHSSGHELRFRLDASVTGHTADLLRAALANGDLDSAQRLVADLGSRARITVELWATSEDGSSFGGQGAVGGKVGLKATSDEGTARRLGSAVYTL